jgi:two-component system cell cycle sensor histidine kinase/response regulator CckA
MIEERLAQRDAAFRLLFMNNPQPMWVFDVRSQRFLEVNSAAVDHYGYSREEFLSMRISDIGPPEDVPRLLEDITRARSGLRHAGIWKHRLKDGRVIDVEVTSDHLTFAGEEAVLVVARDVTEQKRAEEALRRTEQKYRSMIEDAIVGIFQSTPQGRYLSVNPALATMLGYESPPEVIETITDIGAQVYVNPVRRREFTTLLREQGSVRNFEVELYRKDGSTVWMSASVRAIHQDGEVVRYEGMNEDITKRKVLESQLLQSQKMEAVGLLASGVAHDFNNALGVIAGYSSLLQMHLPAGDSLWRYAEEITKASHRAATLTRQLLAFSRKQVIQPVILDLNSVVADMGKMLRRLIGEDIEIVVTAESNLGRVKADPGQLEQILMNLAVNARDAMPQGGKVIIGTANTEVDAIYARVYAYFKPGSYVTLSFSDTGCGMDRETQARIFEPFFTTKEPGRGTGLGLSTVYGIVKQNDGYIRVYSEPGKGTTFKIYLPRTEKAAQPSGVTPAPVSVPQGCGTVLLVEDEAALRALARDCLESHGYTVLEAGNGKAAIAVAQKHAGPIQLLLTDVVMPGLSGRELATRLSESRPEIKVVYMSGYASDLTAQYGVLDPDIILLEKPFTLQALLVKVHQALTAPEKSRAAGAS